MVIDISAVRSDVQQRDLASKPGKELRSNGRCSPVSAIDNDLTAAQVQARHGREQRRNVFLGILRLVFDGGDRIQFWSSRGQRVFEDHLFNGQFHLVRQLLTIRAEELDPVILPRIM